MLLTNSAEGGTNTTTVSTANSGGSSGNAWDGVGVPANSTVTFSNTQVMHGTLSYHFTSSAAVNNFLRWDSQLGASGTTMYARAYCYFNGTLPTATRIIQFNDSGSNVQGGVGVRATGQIAIRDSASTLIASSNMTTPSNQWFRLEFMLVSNASTGQMTAWIYANPDDSVATEVVSATGLNTRGGNIAQAVFGNPTSVSGIDLYMDDIAVQDTNYLGPSTPSASLGWFHNT